MRPLVALMAMSIRQALPVRRTAMLVLVQLLPVFIYLLSAQNRTSDRATETFITIGAGMLLGLAVPVTSIVIGAGALGAERRDETLSFIALRPIRRLTLAAIKTIAAVAAATAIGLIGAVALGVAHVAQHGNVSLIPAITVAVFVTTALYTSVLVPLGFLTDRAVLVGLAYLFVFEGGVISALTSLATISPWRIGFSAFAALAHDVPARIYDLTNLNSSLAPSLTVPIASAVVVFAVAVGIAALLLRHRDLA